MTEFFVITISFFCFFILVHGIMNVVFENYVSARNQIWSEGDTNQHIFERVLSRELFVKSRGGSSELHQFLKDIISKYGYDLQKGFDNNV